MSTAAPKVLDEVFGAESITLAEGLGTGPVSVESYR